MSAALLVRGCGQDLSAATLKSQQLRFGARPLLAADKPHRAWTARTRMLVAGRQGAMLLLLGLRGHCE
jgi:hypothetical protein